MLFIVDSQLLLDIKYLLQSGRTFKSIAFQTYVRYKLLLIKLKVHWPTIHQLINQTKKNINENIASSTHSFHNSYHSFRIQYECVESAEDKSIPYGQQCMV